jgi:CPA1 family monovalent cation:H+ antiporter
LISATDPVAVIALFKELGAPLRLTTLVEGESLFNDATAIVLFHILLTIALAGGITFADAGIAVGEFFKVFFGGVVVGTVVGLGISELMRRLHSSHIALLVMSLVMAWVSFVLAEHLLHVSGVMSAVAAALAMGLYAVTRIPEAALSLIRETWEVIALICNSLLFLMIGLSVDFAALAAQLPAILLAVALVLMARAATVYSLVPATTRLFPVPPVSAGERTIMWWGGLKGGLAIAIVLSLPADFPLRQLLVELTLGVVLFTLLINAPTIRPVIKLLGIDRLTENEQMELRRGLRLSRREAESFLGELGEAELLSADVQQEIGRRLTDKLRGDGSDGEAPSSLRRAYLEALRLESAALQRLFRVGLIEEYTYLDLATGVRRRREYWSRHDSGATDNAKPSMFRRLEEAVIRRLRELDWAAPLLARYQRLRISQQLQRDIAGILIFRGVIEGLTDSGGLQSEHSRAVQAEYDERLTRRRRRVEQIRRQFPEFYRQFEQRFFQQAALKNAHRALEEAHHHGTVGAKVYTRIDDVVSGALEELPDLPSANQRPEPRELIEQVPMFRGLPDAVLQRLAGQCREVSFLPGDIVIGERERGNALYIIMRGRVAVFKGEGVTQKLQANLGAGDFFGEAALLGDDVRTASVRAEQPLTLLRLTRSDVLQIASEDAAFERHLRDVHVARTG